MYVSAETSVHAAGSLIRQIHGTQDRMKSGLGRYVLEQRLAHHFHEAGVSLCVRPLKPLQCELLFVPIGVVIAMQDASVAACCAISIRNAASASGVRPFASKTTVFARWGLFLRARPEDQADAFTVQQPLASPVAAR